MSSLFCLILIPDSFVSFWFYPILIYTLCDLRSTVKMNLWMPKHNQVILCFLSFSLLLLLLFSMIHLIEFRKEGWVCWEFLSCCESLIDCCSCILHATTIETSGMWLSEARATFNALWGMMAGTVIKNCLWSCTSPSSLPLSPFCFSKMIRRKEKAQYDWSIVKQQV